MKNKGYKMNQQAMKEENKNMISDDKSVKESNKKEAQLKAINKSGGSGKIIIENYNPKDFGLEIPEYRLEPVITEDENGNVEIKKMKSGTIEEKYLCNGATLKCSKGTIPSILKVLPIKGVKINNQPVAVISDMKPMVNIMPFGVCKRPYNPPCTPIIAAQWSKPITKNLIDGEAMVGDKSTLNCSFGGEISVTNAGQNGVGYYKNSKKNKEKEDNEKEEKNEKKLEILEPKLFLKRKSYHKSE